jgi:3-deoxy-7-phosphoheptulonate synthase
MSEETRPERAAAGYGPIELRAADFPLAGKRSGEARTEVTVGAATIGAGAFTLIAGPCAVESYEQFLAAATAVKEAGFHLVRGGAFKPRTSPYSFAGLREAGLEIIARVKTETGLAFVTELMEPAQAEAVVAVADMIQIGSRNMQNFPLLHAAGRLGMPVLLKRGFGNTLHELVMAAEHIMTEGNEQVVLCERGIRTFDQSQRNTLDLMAVPILKSVTHLPVIIDPSHSVGIPQIIPAALKAALALEADGALLEIHPDRERALSDGAQSLSFSEFGATVAELRRMAGALGMGVN